MKKLFCLLAVCVAAPAFAASVENVTPTGKYALKKADCGNELFVTLTPKRVDFLTYSCDKVAYDQTENKGGKVTYAVTSKACIGEEDTKPKADHFTLVLENDTLQVLWADGTKSAKAVLCKK